MKINLQRVTAQHVYNNPHPTPLGRRATRSREVINLFSDGKQTIFVIFLVHLPCFWLHFKMYAGEHTRRWSPTYAHMVAYIYADGLQQTHAT